MEPDNELPGYYAGEKEGHLAIEDIYEKLVRKTKMDKALEACPKIRILMFGSAGAGKTTTLNYLFPHTKNDNPSHDQMRGNHDIRKAYTSDDAEYNRCIIHDSRGTQAGQDGELEIAKAFVKECNAKPDIRDHVHAIW